MDIYAFSIKMEEDAEALYRSLAKESDHKGIQNIFNLLADDENRHRKAIEIIKKKAETATESSIDEIITIFKWIQNEGEVQNISQSILPELQKALHIEKQGMEYYKDQLGKPEDEAAKKLFTLLSRQEKQHYETVKSLIEMVEKPQWWVENAEFTPLGDDYY